jgi:hypothetical protein
VDLSWTQGAVGRGVAGVSQVSVAFQLQHFEPGPGSL